MRSIETTDMQPPSTLSAGPAPMLDWLPISKLVIGDEYQRPLGAGNWKAIRKIADSFTWSKFAPVLVAPIEGGVFAVIDGQHRAHAAAICGFERVPCQITQMGRAEQASAFAAVNGDVIKVSTWQVFKAALLAGEAWATEIRDCAAAAGCVVMTRNSTDKAKRPGEIYSVKSIKELVERFGAAKVTSALVMIKAATVFSSDAENWAYAILIPVLNALLSRPYSMERKGWSKAFFDDLDVLALQEQAAKDIRRLRQQGAVPPQKTEMLEALIGEQIDQAMGDIAFAPVALIGGR